MRYIVLTILLLLPGILIAQIGFKRYHPCSFSISLPKGFSIKPLEKESNFDYCDYKVKTAEGKEVLQLHSLLASRYMDSDIKTLYAIEQKMDDINISYQVQKANWFVISGTDKKTGNRLYRKTIVGERFVSELRIDYPLSLSAQIEPHIAKIAASFTSE